MPNLEGWHITADHSSAFVRTFTAYPTTDDTKLEDYLTVERHGQRYIDAVYPARVSGVNIRWQWDEKENYWWGSADRTLYLLNERTGKRYGTGWKSETIRPRDEKVTPAYMAELLAATNPNSVITVTETPVD
jgi:hypothetical protein